MFAKYINTTTIEPAPRNKDQWSNYDQNETLLLADGYLPVVVIEAPTVEKPIIKYRLADNKIEQYAEELPTEQKQSEVRAVRNHYLTDTDKYMIVDYPISDEEREEYKAYRNYLRNYPETENWYEQNPLTFEQWNELSGISGELDTIEEITNV